MMKMVGHCAITFFENSGSEKEMFRSSRTNAIGASETNPVDRRHPHFKPGTPNEANPVPPAGTTRAHPHEGAWER
jgi:hypothetical protein